MSSGQIRATLVRSLHLNCLSSLAKHEESANSKSGEVTKLQTLRERERERDREREREREKRERREREERRREKRREERKEREPLTPPFIKTSVENYASCSN